MKFWATEIVLSILPSSDEGWYFDRSGRLFAQWDQGWYTSIGLSGRAVRRRWRAARREVETLSPADLDRVRLRSKEVLRIIQQRNEVVARRDTSEWVARAVQYPGQADAEAFRRIYRRVGILPPDQYDSSVIQITQGCSWNECTFCHFYRNVPFSLRRWDDIERSIEEVRELLGEGLSRRRSVFLGEANALAAPVEIVRRVMRRIRASWVPQIPQFRGFFSFIEPAESVCRTASDFRALSAEGLKRVYYGLETGNEGMRQRLGKPGHLEDFRASIRNAKEGGVLTAVILLVGAGGESWAQKHFDASVDFVKSLPLDERDIVYLSPLRGRDGLKGKAFSAEALEEEVLRFKSALSPGFRAVPYDIREFIY